MLLNLSRRKHKPDLYRHVVCKGNKWSVNGLDVKKGTFTFELIDLDVDAVTVPQAVSFLAS